MTNVVRLQDDLFQFNCHRFSVEGSETLILAAMLAFGIDLDDALDLLSDSESTISQIEQELDAIL